MERMTIKEFKDQSNIEIIESIMKMNNGYVTSKELSNLGIHRMYLNNIIYFIFSQYDFLNKNV